jgi:hypothetical protein
MIVAGTRYTAPVAGKQPAIRFGDLNQHTAQRSRAVIRHAAFVFASAFARPLWAGLGGETFGSAGFRVCRFANPVQCPLTPFGDGKRVSNDTHGGRTMLRHIPARPGQTQSPIEIIRAALRDAATAPTVFDALDVTGDALRRLAELARAEVRHA